MKINNVDLSSNSTNKRPKFSNITYNHISGLIDPLTSKIDANLIPAVAGTDEILEYNNLASFPVSGDTNSYYIDKATDLIYRWTGSAYQKLVDLSNYSTTSQANALYSAIGHTHSSLTSLALPNGINKLTLGTINDLNPNFGDSNIILNTDNTNDTLTIYTPSERTYPVVRIDPVGIISLTNDLNVGSFSVNTAGSQVVSSGMIYSIDGEPKDTASKQMLRMGGFSSSYTGTNSTGGVFHCISASNTSIADPFYYEQDHVEKIKMTSTGSAQFTNYKCGSKNLYF